MTPATHTLLQLCCTMDVKGTMSGKRAIHRDYKPVDTLGFMLQEHGYKFEDACGDSNVLSPDSKSICPYRASCELLNITGNRLTQIWREINRENSTNQTIKEKIIKVCSVPEDVAQQYRAQGTVDDEGFETL